MNDPSEDISRILALIPFVRENPGVSLDELAQHFRCTPKDIQKDLNRILLCGVPPYLPDDYIGVYMEGDRVEINFADQFVRPIRLTLQEALALRLAIESLPRSGDAAIRRARESLLEKLNDLVQAAGMDERVTSTRETSRLEHNMDTAQEAIRESKKLQMTYYSQSSDEVRERTVSPYGLLEDRGKLYLVAHDDRHDKVLTFRTDRIGNLEPLNETFTIPDEFDLEAFSRKRKERRFTPEETDGTKVTIRFSASSARYIREEFPEDQLETETEGSVVLTLTVGSPTWLFRWILQYGEQAEILEPEDFRDQFKTYLEGFLSKAEALS